MENSQKKKLYKRLMFLDFIFGAICLMLTFLFFTPSNVAYLTRIGGPEVRSYDIAIEYLCYFIIRPFTFIYSIHRFYSGFKNMMLHDNLDDK